MQPAHPYSSYVVAITDCEKRSPRGMVMASVSSTNQARSGTEPQEDQIKRRDFLYMTTAATALIGTAAALWPMIDSMNPSADVLAGGGPVDIDVSGLSAGDQKLVSWRSKPMFILRRSPQMLDLLREKQVVSLLRDPNSEQHQQAAYADNWHRSIKPEYAVLVGICTHLGCIPELQPRPGSVGPGWLGGYFCPCHGSKYDFAGRVYKGVPAPLNLPVPPYRFTSDTVIRLGENPPGSNFSLSSIEQL
jgi:ubiquinol-cytochrome c reductase iron-sulfur subunit